MNEINKDQNITPRQRIQDIRIKQNEKSTLKKKYYRMNLLSNKIESISNNL